MENKNSSSSLVFSQTPSQYYKPKNIQPFWLFRQDVKMYVKDLQMHCTAGELFELASKLWESEEAAFKIVYKAFAKVAKDALALKVHNCAARTSPAFDDIHVVLQHSGAHLVKACRRPEEEEQQQQALPSVQTNTWVHFFITDWIKVNTYQDEEEEDDEATGFGQQTSALERHKMATLHCIEEETRLAKDIRNHPLYHYDLNNKDEEDDDDEDDAGEYQYDSEDDEEDLEHHHLVDRDSNYLRHYNDYCDNVCYT